MHPEVAGGESGRWVYECFSWTRCGLYGRENWPFSIMSKRAA